MVLSNYLTPKGEGGKVGSGQAGIGSVISWETFPSRPPTLYFADLCTLRGENVRFILFCSMLSASLGYACANTGLEVRASRYTHAGFLESRKKTKQNPGDYSCLYTHHVYREHAYISNVVVVVSVSRDPGCFPGAPLLLPHISLTIFIFFYFSLNFLQKRGKKMGSCLRPFAKKRYKAQHIC